VIGDRASSQESATRAYTELLLQEIASSAKAKAHDAASSSSPSSSCLSESEAFASTSSSGINGGSVQGLETIYFGGGTPSLLPVDCVQKILASLRANFGIHEKAEVTLEMDPGTFDAARLDALLAVGVNRISMGVQSFSDQVLTQCGRAHDAQDVQRALAFCRDNERLDNFSLDLISSLPHVNLGAWRDTLRQAAESGCTHISVYDLQIEDKTAFGRWYKPGEFPLPTDALSADMYKAAVEILTRAGFEHYEVSNYARPGKRSRHNTKYWACEPVWGFGMGAASFVNGLRATRPTKMQQYAEWVQLLQERGYEQAIAQLLALEDAASIDGRDDDGDDDIDVDGDESSTGTHTNTNASFQVGTETDEALEVVMLALRTADGLDVPAFAEKYGNAYVDKILSGVKQFAGQGLVQLKRAAAPDCSLRNVRLTDPDGFLMSNDVISSIFAEFIN